MRLSRDEYNRHIEKKDKARRAKNEAKASSGPEKMAITMDLQSINCCVQRLKHQSLTTN